MNQNTAIRDLAASDVATRIAAAEWLSQQTDLDGDSMMAAMEGVADQDEQVREWCVATLESLESPDPAYLNELTKRLNHSSDDVVYWAITLLGRLGSDAANASSVLANLVGDETAALTTRERAAWALGKIGVSAPWDEALQRAVASPHKRLADIARRSLGCS